MKKKPVHFKFRLYVIGNAPNSQRALVNLRALCAEHLPGRHEIEIIDVVIEPKRALTDGVMLTPLLIRVSPGPVCRIVGSLTHREPVLFTLGLPA
jgi:circadian clock protein KaiB